MGLTGATGAGATFTVRRVTANATVEMPVDGHVFYVITAGRSNITLTLPSAAGAIGRMIIVRRDGFGRRVSVRAQSKETIEGSPRILALNSNSDGLTLVSDGQNWVLLYRTR
jgi:hypothetical protein